MRYAVVLGSDVCMISRHLAAAETESEFFSTRYGKPVRLVLIGDDDDADSRLFRQLAIRNPREQM
ncbi:hypothetical protein ATY81_26945 [Rhizobium sp. R72]|uniref:hypothetical protein n=1 Tax=unclassified Rhizobium TaxID=2613769 RepID=UPI000B52CD1A|nr:MULTISPECIES: hypothetical protein [unclassified Rhizobium]OWV98666.1 hypothetical protein ATY81_26945 [Rhizobium sp. R72]OWV98700.1 hypothetical protein ATY80_26945 [Rhizobium sp. R711]